MWLLVLIFVIVRVNQWMHENDRMLYTRKELEKIRREAAERESRPPPALEAIEGGHALLGRPER